MCGCMYNMKTAFSIWQHNLQQMNGAGFTRFKVPHYMSLTNIKCTSKYVGNRGVHTQVRWKQRCTYASTLETYVYIRNKKRTHNYDRVHRNIHLWYTAVLYIVQYTSLLHV